MAIAAMAVANSALGGAYHTLFDTRLAWSPVPTLDSLHMWINDAVMVVFFFVVGLEVKREVLIGDLSDGKTPAPSGDGRASNRSSYRYRWRSPQASWSASRPASLAPSSWPTGSESHHGPAE